MFELIFAAEILVHWVLNGEADSTTLHWSRESQAEKAEADRAYSNQIVIPSTRTQQQLDIDSGVWYLAMQSNLGDEVSVLSGELSILVKPGYPSCPGNPNNCDVMFATTVSSIQAGTTVTLDLPDDQETFRVEVRRLTSDVLMASGARVTGDWEFTSNSGGLFYVRVAASDGAPWVGGPESGHYYHFYLPQPSNGGIE